MIGWLGVVSTPSHPIKNSSSPYSVPLSGTTKDKLLKSKIENQNSTFVNFQKVPLTAHSPLLPQAGLHTHSAQSNSACIRTVFTASSCKSGGQPCLFRMRFTITLILTREPQRGEISQPRATPWDQSPRTSQALTGRDNACAAPSGLAAMGTPFPGRCPGLACAAPLALKSDDGFIAGSKAFGSHRDSCGNPVQFFTLCALTFHDKWSHAGSSEMIHYVTTRTYTETSGSR